ncbi:hypothetical protein EDD28_0557 [Salana multivorans]|uniref:Uncharacterized protein n=1 Tax=Salana multivorans TaxID=120377 RepID=A0A3N2D883_9MICO|nr:hypothetical protein [Salana multivorans]ROR95987.1 hypothetical protein EDD28_0557 [Salana multivorans]
MALNDINLRVPLDSDTFDPSGDMRKLASSIGGSSIVPVANTVGRDALVAGLGWTPTPTRPLYVHRANAATGWEIELTTNGTTWRSLYNNWSGDGFATAASGWSLEPTLNSVIYRRAGWIWGSLRARRTAGVISPDANGVFATVEIATINSAWAPQYLHPAPIVFRHTSGGVRGGMGRVWPTGRVEIVQGPPGSSIQTYGTAGEYSVNVLLNYPEP